LDDRRARGEAIVDSLVIPFGVVMLDALVTARRKCRSR
jgi:hypothetical protein